MSGKPTDSIDNCFEISEEEIHKYEPVEIDIAMDIKVEFDDAIEEGMTVKKATKLILESFEDVLEGESKEKLLK